MTDAEGLVINPKEFWKQISKQYSQQQILSFIRNHPLILSQWNKSDNKDELRFYRHVVIGTGSYCYYGVVIEKNQLCKFEYKKMIQDFYSEIGYEGRDDLTLAEKEELELREDLFFHKNNHNNFWLCNCENFYFGSSELLQIEGQKFSLLSEAKQFFDFKLQENGIILLQEELKL